LFLQRSLGTGKHVEGVFLIRLALYGLLGVVAQPIIVLSGLSTTTAFDASLLGTTIRYCVRRHSLHRDQLTSVLGMASCLVFFIMAGRICRRHCPGFFIVANSFCYGAMLRSQRHGRKYGPLTVITWIFVFGSIFTLPSASH
jgi:hypothetical protein